MRPLSWLYNLGRCGRKLLVRPRPFPLPTLVLGGITVGGSGKTPAAIALAQFFQERGYVVHCLSRGYGGTHKGVTRVTQTHTAREVGDEPLLLAEHTPTWVAVDRYRAACKAAESGAQLLVADDGFHNPRLRAETSILVYDAVQGAGNGALFPAGPLRAPLEEILSRTTLVLSLGGPFPYATSAPVLRADLSPVFPESLKGRRLLAFAGLGYPEKFFHTLRAQQAQLVETHVFPDHHFYTEAELRDLLQQAEAYGADLMTTRKDFVRIPDSMRAQISSLEVSWTWRSPEQSRRLLEQLVRG